MKHLSRYNHRLFLNHTFIYYLSLYSGNPLKRNLYSKIATRYHDTIRHIDNIIYIVNTLLVLYLRNYLYITSVLIQNFLYGKNVIGRSYKGMSDKVNIKFYSKQYVVIVTFCYCGKIYVFSRHVHTLVRTEHSVILHLSHKHRSSVFNDLHVDFTVVKQDVVTDFYISCEILITYIYNVVRGVHSRTSENLHDITGFIMYRILYVCSTDFRSFCIYHQSYMRRYGTHIPHYFSYSVRCGMSRIHSYNIHAGKKQFTYKILRATPVTDRGDDFCLFHNI